MDVTYFDGWGVLVVIDPYAEAMLGENTVLYYAVLESTERTVDYEVAADTIESMGYSILAVTIDGRRGVNMLEARGIPVQHCQFHQLMAMTRCLTKKPRLTQNIELRAIALTCSTFTFLTNNKNDPTVLVATLKQKGSFSNDYNTKIGQACTGVSLYLHSQEAPPTLLHWSRGTGHQGTELAQR